MSHFYKSSLSDILYGWTFTYLKKKIELLLDLAAIAKF